MKEFIIKNKNILIPLGLALLCFIIFIYGLGTYPLLDADETRYADMSRSMLQNRDFITLYLDGKIFWDKPPLFFWIESLSFYIFHICNEFSVRFPTVMCAIIPCFALYFIGKNLVNRQFGIFSALILITSVEYVIFAKVAILDMVLSTFITLSVLSAIMTYFVQEGNKKYLWWLFYIFSALGMLAKGIPAVVVPFGTMFFIGLYKKNIKDFFKPQYILPGLALFLLISAPWHILMYKIHGFEFIKEYIIKHHLMRFVGSESIGRIHSFWYFIPVFVVGFLPWALSFIFPGVELIKKRKNIPVDDFVIMNIIGFVFTLVFFSIAKTKLITYILPLYPFAAVICAYLWNKYVSENLFKKSMDISNYITFGALSILGILTVSMKLFLPQELYSDIKDVQIFLSILFLSVGIAGIISIKRECKKSVFLIYVITAMLLSSFGIPKLMNIWYKFGQNDLMSYARYAREHNLKLAALFLWERYSLQYYYNGDVLYYTTKSDDSPQYVQTKNFNNNFKDCVMVIEHRKLEGLGNQINYKVIKRGKRYDLIQDDSNARNFPEHK